MRFRSPNDRFPPNQVIRRESGEWQSPILNGHLSGDWGAARLASCGTFGSNTMIVMMIAITRSAKASSRSFPNVVNHVLHHPRPWKWRWPVQFACQSLRAAGSPHPGPSYPDFYCRRDKNTLNASLGRLTKNLLKCPARW